LNLKTGALLEDQDVLSLPAKYSAREHQYHNTIKYIIRDKSHSKTPVHSIVTEIANAMTNPGHSGRRGASPATGPVSSAWLRSRTVMSMAISCHRPNEIRDRLERVLRFKVENCSVPNRYWYSHTRSARTKLLFDCTITYQNDSRCDFCTVLPLRLTSVPSVGACLGIAAVMLTICPLWPA
jgi:hypothetical protein